MKQETKFQEFEDQTQFNGKIYDDVWTERFNFYQKNGSPSSETFKKAYKKIDGLVAKLRMNMNFYAFFFGIIYFLIKGMYKGALTLLAVYALLSVILMFVPEGIVNSVSNGIGIASGLLAGMTANYTFYRKEILGEDDFNIFKGMRM